MLSLASQVLAGDLRALSRACRIVDDRSPGYRALLRALYGADRQPWVLGITGSPGAGKSTLTSALIKTLREQERRVAVVAIDPSSPFSGGAILGDRIRMQDHFLDDEVFIRSLATRGALGGLSRSTLGTLVVLSAWQPYVIIIETVGVGQDELDVATQADTTLVVTEPGGGDGIQAIKAGLIECADLLCVNKADKPGKDETVRVLESALALRAPMLPDASQVGHGHGVIASGEHQSGGAGWEIPIACTVATTGEGVGELLENLERHRAFVRTSDAGRAHQKKKLGLRLAQRFRESLLGEAEDALQHEFAPALERLLAGSEDPQCIVDDLVATFCKKQRGD